MSQDDDLRRAYRADRTGEPLGDHPSPEALAALAQGEGDENVRLRHLDHAMACPQCRAELELLRSIARAEREEAGRGRIPAWLPLAAVVVLAAGVGTLWLQLGRPGEDPLRAGTVQEVLLSPAPDAGGRPGRFVWHRVRDADSYRFELLSEDGTIVASMETTDTTYALPDPSVLREGTAYRWWVTARLADGTQERSETRRLAPTTP